MRRLRSISDVPSQMVTWVLVNLVDAGPLWVELYRATVANTRTIGRSE
jgi:hypothetical protein